MGDKRVKKDKSTIGKAFGTVLRRLREETGLSHINFSDRLEMNRTHYGRIERGEVSPGLDTIEVLARGLNIEVSELMILVDQERKRIVKGYVVKTGSGEKEIKF